MDSLARLARELQNRDVRFLVIGVAGANYWAVAGADLFSTRDRDLFLPLDPDNLLRAWEACDAIGLEILTGLEPLDRPRNRWLAERVVDRRVATRATNRANLEVDLTLVMAGFDFETAWAARREFTVDDVPIPVARLAHIVASKQAAGREKDRLFLATHRQALEDLLGREREVLPGAVLTARLADITTLDVDAIVNAANTALAPGGGVCGAIHRAAGPELAEACARVAPCPTGEARITPGFNLPAKLVIHAVGPVWHGGGQGEAEQLASAYRSSLALVREHGVRTIAFPAISTGIFGFPLDQATEVAVQTVRAEAADSPVTQVVFACFSDEVLAAYRKAGVQD